MMSFMRGGYTNHSRPGPSLEGGGSSKMAVFKAENPPGFTLAARIARKSLKTKGDIILTILCYCLPPLTTLSPSLSFSRFSAISCNASRCAWPSSTVSIRCRSVTRPPSLPRPIAAAVAALT